MADQLTAKVSTADDTTINDVTTEIYLHAAVQSEATSKRHDDELDVFLKRFEGTSTLEHVIAVTLFATFGIVGNSLVIHIYRKKSGSNNVGNLYLIMIAATDIFACCTLLPIYPFIRYMYRDKTLIALRPFVFLLQNMINSTYLWILSVMALERVLAVFRPFTFRSIRRRLLCIAFVWFTFQSLIVVSVSFNATPLERDVFVGILQFIILGSISIIVISYLSIAAKIYSESNKISKYRQQDDEANVRGDIKTEATLDETKIKTLRQTKPTTSRSNVSTNRNLHITTIKLVVAIVAIFLLSFIPTFLASALRHFYLSYLYFFNHVANPFAYYVINRQFRHDVRALFARR